MKYEEDITIDPDALDTEWLQQPRLMLKYCKISAQQEMEYELAKENLDLIKADLDKDIRSDPEKFGITKLTETAVSNTIISHALYKEASKAVIQRKYEWGVSKGAVKSLDHKKDALENLVSLFGKQYFAGPKIPRDLSHEWENKQHQENANAIVEKGMARTRHK